MAGVQGSALAIAVCNAGGIGSLPGAMLSCDGLRTELAAIRAETARPYNVNFFCHSVPHLDASRESAWRAMLTPYYAEFGLRVDAAAGATSRAPFDVRFAEVLEEFKPPIVSFHFGLPAADLIGRVRRWDCKILASATTLEEARWLEARGVNFIIAQGTEAGGHRGSFLTEDSGSALDTLALVSQLVRAVRVPVIAAGGIGDARGVTSALALGAAAAQLGSAYLLCPEATTGAVHRAALASGSARHTAMTNLFSGRPARGIVNRLMRELGPLRSDIPEFPLASAALAPLRAHAERLGSGDFSPLWCGQHSNGPRAAPAADVTRAMAAAS